MKIFGLAWYNDLLIAAGAVTTIGAAAAYLSSWMRGLITLASRRRPKTLLDRAPDAPSAIASHVVELEPEPQQRALLRHAGMVNQLVSRYQITNFAPPLAYGETGSVVRVVLGAGPPAYGAQLDTATKEKLRDALQDSSLESWLSDETLNQGAGQLWVKESPNTGYATTWKRPPVTTINEGSLLSAKCLFQLPIGLMSGPYALLIIDVVEQAALWGAEGSPPPRFRFTLQSLYGLLHTLATTAIEEVGARVFPMMIVSEEAGLIGPNLEINFGDRTLADMVVLPRTFDRPGTASDAPWAYINTPDDTNVRDAKQLDGVLRDGLTAMLRQSEFDGIEDEIAALSMIAMSRRARHELELERVVVLHEVGDRSRQHPDQLRRAVDEATVARDAEWEAAERTKRALIVEGYDLLTLAVDTSISGAAVVARSLPGESRMWATRARGWVAAHRPGFTRELPDDALLDQERAEARVRAYLSLLERI